MLLSWGARKIREHAGTMHAEVGAEASGAQAACTTMSRILDRRLETSSRETGYAHH